MVVLGTFSASACTSVYAVVAGEQEPNPTSHDYCEEVNMHLDEFDSAVWRNYLDDEFEGSSGAIFAAKKVSGLVKRAENQGVDLGNPDAVWFTNLRLAARGFVALADAESGYYSEEDIILYLGRIDLYFNTARDECSKRVA